MQLQSTLTHPPKQVKETHKYSPFTYSQPSSVRVISPQARFTDNHKQDLSLLAPTSHYKVKFFSLDRPVITNSTHPTPH